MRLLEIQADPLSHFMPTKVTPEGNFFCAAPPGLAPELTAMFMFPVRDLRRTRLAGDDVVDPRSPKKARLGAPEANEENDVSIQMGRRDASAQPLDDMPSGMMGEGGMFDNSADFGAGIGGDFGAGADFTLGGEGMDVDVPEIQLDLDKATPVPQRHRSVSRLVDDTRSTPGLGDDDLGAVGIDAYDSQSCTIGLFDIRSSRDSGSKGDTQTQSQTQEVEEIERSTEQVQSKGYSKNTVKAIAVIKKGLEAEKDEEDPFLSFNKVAENASRRAASAFFFELLVLSTRDCVKIHQASPFENIEIRAKDKLFESMSSDPVGA